MQLLQLEEEQPEQDPPVPAMGADSPSFPLEKDAKREKILLAVCWHREHAAFSSALLTGRNSSNLQLHSGQRYS